MIKKESNKTGKHPYEKPRLRTIELVADEVLAVGCKVKGGPTEIQQPGGDMPEAAAMLWGRVLIFH